MKYYKLVVNGYDEGGVLNAPSTWPYPIARDGIEVKNWQSLIVELKDGTYTPFMTCDSGANMINEELKNLLTSYIDDSTDIEFLPIKAVSKEYGDRVYYIVHFTKIYDVIDEKNTIYVPGTNAILKLRLDSNKVKGLKIFNSQPGTNNIIVSEDVYRSIKKAKLDAGLIFREIYSGTE